MHCDKTRLLVIYMHNLWPHIAIVIPALKKTTTNTYLRVFETKISTSNDLIFKILIFMWITINIFLDIHAR